ncbi:glycosyltransferase family 2 protein [Gelidibacter sp. F63206]|uniref:glycosyltransferase family 2 protein n=1 Tax=Gelidibacter sp. F63206 TaxID=2926425 RepID=UPI001FF1D23A|nr:glycosyltransferase family A protein [Gelidibacter sp. F63206]MCK0114775.1 glycosyltransferase family 2 protein [Gelidibacter sp. F63206]
MSFFSIVIPLYNKEKHIKATIESVLAQTFRDFEVIVVNDGSTDGSEAVVNSISDPRITYFKQDNKGASSARNAAISKASGPYLALLDADDLWQEHYLETINQLIKSHPDHHVFAAAVNIETLNGIIRSVYSIKNIKDKEIYIVDYFESSYINTVLTSSSTVVHQSVFDRIGTYDTSLKSGQDTDLWIRIGIQYKVVFINDVLVTYRYAKESLSNRTKRSDKPKYDNYLKFEATNPGLKKFIDLNRFSMAILSKLENDRSSFKRFEKEIDYNNLNKKQQFLLKQPTSVIRCLHFFKKRMQHFGIHLSAFK